VWFTTPTLDSRRILAVVVDPAKVSGSTRLTLLVGKAPLDADQQCLIENGQDALEHRDGGDVVAGLQLRDEGVGGARPLGHVLLREVEFIAPLANVGGDPVFSRGSRTAAYSSRASR
jgi:hypothetical protein